MLAALALVFDMTSVLALMYPGRDRVEVSGLDGTTYVYACKPGPSGEAPRDQATRAHAAFEDYATKFGEAIAAKMMQDIEDGASTFGMALEMTRKTDAWAWAIRAHLEKTYGCALLG